MALILNSDGTVTGDPHRNDPTWKGAVSQAIISPVQGASDSSYSNTMPNQGGYQSTYDVLKAGGNPFTTNTGTTGGTGTTGQSGTFQAGASPNLQSLSDLINSININAQKNANDARIPNASGLEAKSSGNIGDLLSGIVPQDVKNQITQSAAERGVAMGSPGSDNSNSALLRSLGLTSLGLQQQGQSDLTAALGRNPGAKIFDPTSQLLTPYQAGVLNNQNSLLGLDWFKALQGPGYGSRGGGGGGGYSSGGGGTPSGNNSWWNSLFPAAPNPVTTTGSGGGAFGSTATTIPGTGTSVNSGQDWTDLFGDPYANSGGSSGGYVQPDASNQDYWNFNQPSYNDFVSAGYDPFAQY